MVLIWNETNPNPSGRERRRFALSGERVGFGIPARLSRNLFQRRQEAIDHAVEFAGADPRFMDDLVLPAAPNKPSHEPILDQESAVTVEHFEAVREHLEALVPPGKFIDFLVGPVLGALVDRIIEGGKDLF